VDIDKSPPGLLSRRFFPIDRGRWVMEEKWNIDVPGCPLIRSPWLPGPFNDGPIFIRQVEMTAEEYRVSGSVA
jgi:hypothetical protein